MGKSLKIPENMIMASRFKSIVGKEIHEYDLKLFPHHLCVMNATNNKLHGIIDLKYVKCIWVKKEESKLKGLRGITFLKYGKEFEVYC